MMIKKIANETLNNLNILVLTRSLQNYRKRKKVLKKHLNRPLPYLIHSKLAVHCSFCAFVSPDFRIYRNSRFQLCAKNSFKVTG